MTRWLFVALAAVLAAAAWAPARADDGDTAKLSRSSAIIGQQVTLKVQVITPRGATVEVDPAAPSWNGASVIRVIAESARDDGDRTVHAIDLVVAPFLTGDTSFAPAFSVTLNAISTPRVLPPVQLQVLPTLGPNDPLELSPLAPPTAINGAESPLLRPFIGLGIVLAVLLAATGVALAARSVVRRLRRRAPLSTEPLPAPDLGGAEGLLHTDPVAAYRKLAASVRVVISERYGFPAYAMTTGEVQGRMEARGIDSWQARLVRGLLEECDAVVYAGYRPAGERREADLTMAREIVEAAS